MSDIICLISIAIKTPRLVLSRKLLYCCFCTWGKSYIGIVKDQKPNELGYLAPLHYIYSIFQLIIIIKLKFVTLARARIEGWLAWGDLSFWDKQECVYFFFYFYFYFYIFCQVKGFCDRALVSRRQGLETLPNRKIGTDNGFMKILLHERKSMDNSRVYLKLQDIDTLCFLRPEMTKGVHPLDFVLVFPISGSDDMVFRITTSKRNSCNDWFSCIICKSRGIRDFVFCVFMDFTIFWDEILFQ